MRYWLTAGPGNLGVTPDGCTTALYILVFGGLPSDPAWSRDGIAEATVPTSLVPPKPRMCAASTPAESPRRRAIGPSTCHRLAELKSNNYLLNALTAMAARDRGGKFGIVTQDDGAIHVSATRIVRDDCDLAHVRSIACKAYLTHVRSSSTSKAPYSSRACSMCSSSAPTESCARRHSSTSCAAAPSAGVVLSLN